MSQKFIPGLHSWTWRSSLENSDAATESREVLKEEGSSWAWCPSQDVATARTQDIWLDRAVLASALRHGGIKCAWYDCGKTARLGSLCAISVTLHVHWISINHVIFCVHEENLLFTIFLVMVCWLTSKKENWLETYEGPGGHKLRGNKINHTWHWKDLDSSGKSWWQTPLCLPCSPLLEWMEWNSVQYI